MHPAPPFTYVLPIRSGEPLVDDEFSAYLAWVADRAELIVVDASPPGVFAEHARRWGGHGLHVAPRLSTPMGKVGNVLTGLSLAANDRVVIADDDIRYGPELEELVRRLDGAEVVRPQNWFDPLPWHAVWDSGRILISRVWGGDWPGTLAVRSSRVTPAGGYAGDVMFENYELVRTVEAAGGRSAVAADIFVRRRPPTGRHFWSQRVRQAYDELARPARLAVFAPLVPGVAVLAGGRRWRALGGLVAAVSLAAAGAAEWGRRRDGACGPFPLRCSLVAPLWVWERSVCMWAALYARARGGVVYRGRRIRYAALPDRERRRRVAARRWAGCGLSAGVSGAVPRRVRSASWPAKR